MNLFFSLFVCGCFCFWHGLSWNFVYFVCFRAKKRLCCSLLRNGTWRWLLASTNIRVHVSTHTKDTGELGMVTHTCNQAALGSWRQEGHKFKVIFSYDACSRPACATQCLNLNSPDCTLTLPQPGKKKSWEDLSTHFSCFLVLQALGPKSEMDFSLSYTGMNKDRLCRKQAMTLLKPRNTKQQRELALSWLLSESKRQCHTDEIIESLYSSMK